MISSTEAYLRDRDLARSRASLWAPQVFAEVAGSLPVRVQKALPAMLAAWCYRTGSVTPPTLSNIVVFVANGNALGASNWGKKASEVFLLAARGAYPCREETILAIAEIVNR